VPAPLIHVRQGDPVRVSFVNKTPLPPAKEFALVESEFYVRPGPNNTYLPDAEKVLDVKPDYVVFNGVADQ